MACVLFQHRPLLCLRSLQPSRRPSGILLSYISLLAALQWHDIERAEIGQRKSV